MNDYRASRTLFKGKSRVACEGDMSRFEIKNYVHQTPSRPPSSHKFREVNKDKWMDKHTFFLS